MNKPKKFKDSLDCFTKGYVDFDWGNCVGYNQCCEEWEECNKEKEKNAKSRMKMCAGSTFQKTAHQVIVYETDEPYDADDCPICKLQQLLKQGGK